MLAYAAFALHPETRAERAVQAKSEIHIHFNDKQEAFLDFVLAQYVKEGVEELDQEKLSPLLMAEVQQCDFGRDGGFGRCRADQEGVCGVSEVFVPASRLAVQFYCIDYL